MIFTQAKYVVSLLAAFTILCSTKAQEAQVTPESPPLTEKQIAAQIAAEQAEFQTFLDSYSWQSQGVGELSEWATIEIKEGYRFLNGSETADVMSAFGNVPDSYDGMIAVPNMDWFMLFQFEQSGYVKDDEKDDINADKLLKQLKESNEASNEYRKENGIEPLYLEGWASAPKYNDVTNNLEWAIMLRTENGEKIVNYFTKLLGREGIMNVTLVCEPDQLNTLLPNYQSILLGHQYKPGKTYAEYKDGDKVAEYGLTALIAGGALFGAAKIGLLGNIILFFKKGFKFIIIGLIAAGAAIKKFFGRLSGKEMVTEPTTEEDKE